MALTINGNRIGRAAQIEAAEIRERVRQAQSQSLHDETMKLCGELLNTMTLDQYTAFVADAPDGNQAFYEAVKAKHAEMFRREEETDAEHNLDVSCIVNAGCN